MPVLNRSILAGNLCADPELKFIPSGYAVCKFRLAMNRKWKSNGDWKEDVSYVTVVVWGKSAEACGEHLKKGSPALVEGRIQSRSWETADGQKRNTIEVVAERVQFLGSKSSPAGEVGSAEASDNYYAESTSGPDDITF